MTPKIDNMTSFLSMKGGKPASNIRSTPMRPSGLRNEIRVDAPTVSRKDGTPTKASKLQKPPPPVKGAFKPAPKPLAADRNTSSLERPATIKANNTVSVPPHKAHPSTAPSSASPSPSRSSSRGTPAYDSPELRSANHTSSRARRSDRPSASSAPVRQDNSRSDSAVALLQRRTPVRGLREVGTLDSPKAGGRMDKDRVKRYVPDTASTVTSAYNTGDNWVSVMDKFKDLSALIEEQGSVLGSDLLPDFLKIESESDSGTLITRASSGVLPAAELAPRHKPKDKEAIVASRHSDRAAKTSAEQKPKPSASTTRLPQDARSAERRSRSAAVLSPNDSISNFGDDVPRAVPRSSRPPTRDTNSYDDANETVAFRTYTTVEGALRQPPRTKDMSGGPRHDHSVPSVVRSSVSEEDLRTKHNHSSSKTASSYSLGPSSRRVAEAASSLGDSAISSLTSGFTSIAPLFPDVPQPDHAAITVSIIRESIRTWPQLLGMTDIDTDMLFKKTYRNAVANGVPNDVASQVALTTVIDLLGTRIKNQMRIHRTVPPSPRSSSSNSKTDTMPRSTRK